MTKTTKQTRKPSLRNFKVTIEQPRIATLKQEQEITVDTFITYIYGVRNMTNVRQIMASPAKLRELRKQGLRATKPLIKRSDLIIERI
jgi:hypothetical protein